MGAALRVGHRPPSPRRGAVARPVARGGAGAALGVLGVVGADLRVGHRPPSPRRSAGWRGVAPAPPLGVHGDLGVGAALRVGLRPPPPRRTVAQVLGCWRGRWRRRRPWDPARVLGRVREGWLPQNIHAQTYLSVDGDHSSTEAPHSSTLAHLPNRKFVTSSIEVQFISYYGSIMVVWKANGKPVSRVSQPLFSTFFSARFSTRVATPASSLDIVAPPRQIGDIANKGART